MGILPGQMASKREKTHLFWWMIFLPNYKYGWKIIKLLNAYGPRKILRWSLSFLLGQDLGLLNILYRCEKSKAQRSSEKLFYSHVSKAFRKRKTSMTTSETLKTNSKSSDEHADKKNSPEEFEIPKFFNQHEKFSLNAKKDRKHTTEALQNDSLVNYVVMSPLLIQYSSVRNCEIFICEVILERYIYLHNTQKQLKSQILRISSSLL